MARVNLTDDAQSEIMNTYGDIVTGLNDNVVEIIRIMTEFTDATTAKFVEEQTNKLIEIYNERIVKEINDTYDEWMTSDNSLKARINKLNGGEDAEDNADMLMNNMKGRLESNLVVIDELSGHAGAALKIDSNDFEEVSNQIKPILANMEDSVTSNKNKVDEMREENSLAACLNPLTAMLFRSTIPFFKQFCERTLIQIKERFEENVENMVSQYEEAADELSSEGSKVDFESEMNDILNLLGDD